MNIDDVTLNVIDALNAANIPYFLSGSFASNYYGIPRSTEDADFVLQLAGRSLASLRPYLGPEFRLDPQMMFETITATRKHVIDVDGTEFRVELFYLSDDAHDLKRFERRRSVPFNGRSTFLPTAEDVIITKLRWRRDKDREDIRGVIAVQADNIDWPYVHCWCDRHGTRDLLEEIRRSIPPI